MNLEGTKEADVEEDEKLDEPPKRVISPEDLARLRRASVIPSERPTVPRFASVNGKPTSPE